MRSLKALIAKPYAKRIKKKIDKWAARPLETQEQVFNSLIETARNTVFGLDHDFGSINNHSDFTARVPVRDYESLRPYFDRVVNGEQNIVWPGKPIYFAKTSGTTSGTKYIPITEESMPFHIEAARNAILCYIAETGKTDFVDGKMIFLQGSPVLNEKNGIKVGRLSGIVAHYVPKYLQKNRLPSWETNCIEDWEEKVEAVVDETIGQNMTVISGIPSWVQMYFEKLIERAQKPVGEIFKGFQLFIYGGVNYEPYRLKFETLIGGKVDGIELYPASEGFFAFQDCRDDKGMLLLLDSGIFYEFVEADKFFDETPVRLTLKDVKLNTNYVMIISTNAGLWGYNLGDTIEFTSLDPYKVIVTGRIKHFISAFGEHVIGKEVEESLRLGLQKTPSTVTEFTVAPQINPDEGLPYHEWFIEFEKEPESIDTLALNIDRALRDQNAYYDDLISGNILRPLKITPVKRKGFNKYMSSVGKLGGQNKVPRLSNDRKIAESLNELDCLN